MVCIGISIGWIVMVLVINSVSGLLSKEGARHCSAASAHTSLTSAPASAAAATTAPLPADNSGEFPLKVHIGPSAVLPDVSSSSYSSVDRSQFKILSTNVSSL